MPVQLADLENEFKKDPELKKEDLEILKTWLEKQPHLPRITDLKLVCFLHNARCNIEKAKVLIENFYTARTHAPELFLNRNAKDPIIKKQSEIACMGLLPKTKEYDDLRLFMRFVEPSAEHFDYNNMVKTFDMAINLIQLKEGICSGHVLILDSEVLTLGHVMKISLATTKKLAYYLQECFPQRLKAVHIFNVSAITEKLFVFVKPFIKKEYADMIYFHPKTETMYNHFSKDLMPIEYGGKAPSWKEMHTITKQLIAENQEFFDQENKEIVDETKRVGKPKTSTDIFGMEGTFKKLDID